ncbi:pentapeptide repeat-containing protein [Microbacterium sp. A93]|uniref:pentapeptide repeat-containing protein n=1 Tax=Microbacterium sp. A93 TaxID=3450716 RepID=UPI003F43665A
MKGDVSVSLIRGRGNRGGRARRGREVVVGERTESGRAADPSPPDRVRRAEPSPDDPDQPRHAAPHGESAGPFQRQTGRLATWLGAAIWWWPAGCVLGVAAAGALLGPAWALVVATLAVGVVSGAVGAVIGSWRLAVGATAVTALSAAAVFSVVNVGTSASDGGPDLGGAQLRGADLANSDLRGANLRGADLRDACLNGADLRGADLTDADFEGAAVSGVEVNEAATERARNWPRIADKSAACDPS